MAPEPCATEQFAMKLLECARLSSRRERILIGDAERPSVACQYYCSEWCCPGVRGLTAQSATRDLCELRATPHPRGTLRATPAGALHRPLALSFKSSGARRRRPRLLARPPRLPGRRPTTTRRTRQRIGYPCAQGGPLLAGIKLRFERLPTLAATHRPSASPPSVLRTAAAARLESDSRGCPARSRACSSTAIKRPVRRPRLTTAARPPGVRSSSTASWPPCRL